ncbi:hypothetical protein GCM10027191_22340 [Novilysobacter erysipheiresistens]
MAQTTTAPVAMTRNSRAMVSASRPAGASVDVASLQPANAIATAPAAMVAGPAELGPTARSQSARTGPDHFMDAAGYA